MTEDNAPARDHLFISYAGEDATFATWLTLRLTAAGYRVWCDQVKLLGGECYPLDIDLAIKIRTFRLLAIMSRHSLHKPNPSKERTLALNLQRSRKEEFVIPLNLDGLKPEELDWMTSDITFIPFFDSWAKGLRGLLKKLASVRTPLRADDGAPLVTEWVAAQDQIAERKETLWTNVLPCTHLPDALLRVGSRNASLGSLLRGWPAVRVNDREYLLFEIPPTLAHDRAIETSGLAWRSDDERRKVTARLLKRYLYHRCRQKGLVTDDASHRTYFPPGLLDRDRLRFPVGARSSWTKAVGHKTFYSAGARDITRYSLAPEFSPDLRSVDREVVLLKIRVHLTDPQGKALPERTRFRRERSLRSTWWNDDWLRKTRAVASWLLDNAAQVDLALTDQCRIALGMLRTQLVSCGIDEEQFTRADDDEEPDLIVEDDPDTVGGQEGDDV